MKDYPKAYTPKDFHSSPELLKELYPLILDNACNLEQFLKKELKDLPTEGEKLNGLWHAIYYLVSLNIKTIATLSQEFDLVAHNNTTLRHHEEMFENIIVQMIAACQMKVYPNYLDKIKASIIDMLNSKVEIH